jgi:hypothetical protein
VLGFFPIHALVCPHWQRPIRLRDVAHGE